MKQILVISGKGGTGKTFFTSCLAAIVKNKVIVDCDVDAPNLHLLLHPEIKEKYEFFSGKIAEIDKTKCIECGLCKENCKFDAIKEDFQVESLSCEGCMLCKHLCPQDAIILHERLAGHYFISETKYGPFIHARLGIAQQNSGKLVAKLREIAKNVAEEKGFDYIIIDGPPGVGCPVMAAMTGVDIAVAVTEPTPSGIHDLGRVIELTNHFQIPLKVIINKYDLNSEVSIIAESELREKGIEVIGKIPFSEEVLNSIKKGAIFLENSNSNLGDLIRGIIKKGKFFDI